MTTGVLASVKVMDEATVKAMFDKLQGGDYFLMAKPRPGDDLIVHTQLDADGDCFNAVNIGHIVSEPATRDGMGYDIKIALFTMDKGDLAPMPTTKQIHLRRAEGCSERSRR